MARLRIVELPAQHNGDEMTTPFVVVLDQIGEFSPFNSSAGVESFGATARAWGARGALVTTDTVELADELPVAEPFDLVAEGGHRFVAVPKHDGALRCSVCGITRVDWVTRRDVPTCESVLRTKGLG
ncbi:hypothetical protein [Streptomyces swartbergensis]|uniref:Uncharacterized protein n=1 Tax=Streptomyces swartbergensis TaxID=487165 RepID=A0A243S5H1_9ACTN|nr:hypothetical protein [Streptomyces swartbergensis]OUD02557.1 hypothetical protein CA983_14120 [Streptomyces swartbergensis]